MAGRFSIEDHGKILLVRPLAGDVLRWLEAHAAEDARWWAGALVVEPCDLQPLLEGLFEAGFVNPPGDGHIRLSAL